ncbi:aldehyde dehydrogenase family protein, partial [Saccharothrix sp. ST-888]|uniref:aldehyde dehydrogenase family protein n=1 Tax=Saccharothrix sp. ST-888 TaxID=1427391 RepID=UPI0005EBF4E3
MLPTDHPVVVKPHPGATVLLARAARVARRVLAEAAFDANVVCLASENEGSTIAQVLAVRREVKVIDYTGSTAFGEWLETNAGQAQVYT